MNLINNSLQATSKNTRITLACSCEDKRIFIRVTDNGPGMDAVTLEKIQDAFFTSKPQGTGLGLAVVRAVANAHRGEFSLSSSPGAGTTTCIVLPCLEITPISRNVAGDVMLNNRRMTR